MNECTFLHWETIFRSPSGAEAAKYVQIRVFEGGQDSHQALPFRSAMSSVIGAVQQLIAPKELKIESLCVKEVKKRSWGMTELVDWLLSGDIHFVLNHVHQGFGESHYVLDMVNVVQQIKRLKYHNGFPTGADLLCPVFTQDKISYIQALGCLANNTFVIQIQPYASLDPQFFQDLNE